MCESEYVEGFTVCVECDSQLVEELPSKPQPEFIAYDEVLSTFNPSDIAIIKSILDTTDIVYFFHGEHFSYMRPLVLPARLMVRKDQAEEASQILRDLDLSFTGVNLPIIKSLISSLSDRAEFWMVVWFGYGPFLIWQLSRLAEKGFEPVITASDINKLNLVVLELLLAAILVCFLYSRGWRLNNFNCRITLKGTGLGILLWLGVRLLYLTSYDAASSLPLLDTALKQVHFTGHVSLVVALLVSIVNPVFEEFLSLGFVIRHLEAHGARFAVGSGLLLRMLCHIYQGPMAIVSILPSGLLLGAFYWRTRQMWPVVVAHALVDFIALCSLR